jgi:hypothetical protein
MFSHVKVASVETNAIPKQLETRRGGTPGTIDMAKSAGPDRRGAGLSLVWAAGPREHLPVGFPDGFTDAGDSLKRCRRFTFARGGTTRPRPLSFSSTEWRQAGYGGDCPKWKFQPRRTLARSEAWRNLLKMRRRCSGGL